jgi:hypothetical protein
MKKVRTLRELFSFPGFYALSRLEGVFGDPKARIVELKRQKKERYAPVVGRVTAVITMQKFVKCEISMR